MYSSFTGSSGHEQVLKVEKFIPHPDFRKLGPYSHDVAVLLLASPGFKINDVIKPVCFTDDDPPPGTWCEVSGWGATDPQVTDRLSPVLRAAAVPVLSLETCRKKGIYGGRQQQILDSMLCAGHLRGGIDACGGDSGGPLVCEKDGRLELSGIVSWGDGCAKKNRPGVYTRVSSFLPWIKESALDLGVDYDFWSRSFDKGGRICVICRKSGSSYKKNARMNTTMSRKWLDIFLLHPELLIFISLTLILHVIHFLLFKWILF